MHFSWFRNGFFGLRFRGRTYSVLHILRVKRGVKATVRSPRDDAVSGVEQIPQLGDRGHWVP